MSPEQAYQLALMSDPGTARRALSAQWDNVLTALTVPMVSILIPALTTLASGLNTFSRILIEYPALAKSLSVAFVGLAGAMAFGGTVILLTAAFKGLSLAVTMFGLISGVALAEFLVPMAAIGAIVYGGYKLYQLLASLDWSSIWASTKSGISHFFSGLGASILSALTSGLGNLGGAIAKAILNSILPGLGGALVGASIDAAKGKENQTVQVSSNIHLDGKKIGEATTRHIVGESLATPNYTSRFDTGMSPTPVLLNGGYY